MALFSIFGKKPSQADTPAEPRNAPAKPARPAPPSGDEAAVRGANLQRQHRDLARMTAEKIDAIESEITRDILKSPVRKASPSVAVAQSAAANVGESPSTNLFHTTLIRVDKETLILFKEDMDD